MARRSASRVTSEVRLLRVLAGALVLMITALSCVKDDLTGSKCVLGPCGPGYFCREDICVKDCGEGREPCEGRCVFVGACALDAGRDAGGDAGNNRTDAGGSDAGTPDAGEPDAGDAGDAGDEDASVVTPRKVGE